MEEGAASPSPAGGSHPFTSNSPQYQDFLTSILQLPVVYRVEDLLQPDAYPAADTGPSTAEVSAMAGFTGLTDADLYGLPPVDIFYDMEDYSPLGDSTGLTQPNPCSTGPSSDDINGSHGDLAGLTQPDLFSTADTDLPPDDIFYAMVEDYSPLGDSTGDTGLPPDDIFYAMEDYLLLGEGDSSGDTGGLCTTADNMGISSPGLAAKVDTAESKAGLAQPDPEDAANIKPPAGSTDAEIIRFLQGEEVKQLGNEVNCRLADEDQTKPKAVRSYVTSERMMPDLKTPHGHWKEKSREILHNEALAAVTESLHALTKDLVEQRTLDKRLTGIMRSFQFHMEDGTKTNWHMHEYVPTESWGTDLYCKGPYFRKVFQIAQGVLDEPSTSTRVNFTSKIGTGKHRMRGPGDPKILGRESPVWQDFIKIYDKHPELDGSKVLYAVCCHCDSVLKAGTENGTKSLLTHRDHTCPRKPLQGVSCSLADQDQMVRTAVQCYVTSMRMMPEQMTPLDGDWKEKYCKFVFNRVQPRLIIPMIPGLERTFQFHKEDRTKTGTKTNWFMNEYIPMDKWGIDLYLMDFCFRKVFNTDQEEPGQSTPVEVIIKRKNATVKHRMRRPDDPKVKGRESPVWQHFIKIYNKYPELERSKVVYAVCCYCDGVLKAGTENGTKSLSTHFDRTCPSRKHPQTGSSSLSKKRPRSS